MLQGRYSNLTNILQTDYPLKLSNISGELKNALFPQIVTSTFFLQFIKYSLLFLRPLFGDLLDTPCRWLNKTVRDVNSKDFHTLSSEDQNMTKVGVDLSKWLTSTICCSFPSIRYLTFFSIIIIWGNSYFWLRKIEKKYDEMENN